jgi:hypothetical protein
MRGLSDAELRRRAIAALETLAKRTPAHPRPSPARKLVRAHFERIDAYRLDERSWESIAAEFHIEHIPVRALSQALASERYARKRRTT